MKAWAPGHATLFFAVPKKFDIPLQMGSIGGGFNFSEGVETSVSDANEDAIYWNSKKISGEVSTTTLNLFRTRASLTDTIFVKHFSNLKIGYGLSTSGAGAISLLLALNHYFDTGFENNELYQMAHEAEIFHHTGLGSVIGQINSGIELRVNQGGPGFGEILSFPDNSPVFIVMLGALKTSDIITSEDIMENVTISGIDAVARARQIGSDYAFEFLKIGKQFAKKCGLLTSRMRTLMQDLTKIGELNSSMAMIGETLIILPNNEEILEGWLLQNNHYFIKTMITNRKPSIMS